MLTRYAHKRSGWWLMAGCGLTGFLTAGLIFVPALAGGANTYDAPPAASVSSSRALAGEQLEATSLFRMMLREDLEPSWGRDLQAPQRSALLRGAIRAKMSGLSPKTHVALSPPVEEVAAPVVADVAPVEVAPVLEAEAEVALETDVVEPELEAAAEAEVGPEAEVAEVAEAPEANLEAAPAAVVEPAAPAHEVDPNASAYEIELGARVDRESLQGKMHLPLLRGRVTQGFGVSIRAKSKTSVRHTGWAIKGPNGHRVRAAMGGKVAFAGPFKGYGLMVVVDHGAGIHTVYGHLKVIHVKEGQVLERGAQIGANGGNGALGGDRLYFELRENGAPIDPKGWFLPAHAELN